MKNSISMCMGYTQVTSIYSLILSYACLENFEVSIEFEAKSKNGK
jgi:hypothetical protein